MKIRLYKIISIPRNTTTAEKNIPVHLSVNRDNCFLVGIAGLEWPNNPFSFIVNFVLCKRHYLA